MSKRAKTFIGECTYEFNLNRYQVKVPFTVPQMGEYASKIIVKVMCLQTCMGGPNQRPFVLVFTLKNKNGEEIGRQILDVKCCKCPSRDMKNDEEKQVQHVCESLGELNPKAQ